MGAIHNISFWTIAALTAALLVLAPAAATADETAPSQLEPIEAPGQPSLAPTTSTTSGPVEATLPLTRAASRMRVEAMSPMDWLASYGDVVVGRPEGPATGR